MKKQAFLKLMAVAIAVTIVGSGAILYANIFKTEASISDHAANQIAETEFENSKEILSAHLTDEEMAELKVAVGDAVKAELKDIKLDTPKDDNQDIAKIMIDLEGKILKEVRDYTRNSVAKKVVVTAPSESSGSSEAEKVVISPETEENINTSAAYFANSYVTPLETEVVNLRQTARQSKAKINSLNNELADSKQQSIKTAKDLKKEMASLGETLSKKNLTNSDIEKAQSDIVKIQSDISSMQSGVSSIDKLAKKSLLIEGDLEDKVDIADLDDLQGDYEKSVNAINTLISEAKASIGQSNTDISALNSIASNFKTQLDILNSQLEDSKVKITVLRTQSVGGLKDALISQVRMNESLTKDQKNRLIDEINDLNVADDTPLEKVKAMLIEQIQSNGDIISDTIDNVYANSSDVNSAKKYEQVLLSYAYSPESKLTAEQKEIVTNFASQTDNSEKTKEYKLTLRQKVISEEEALINAVNDFGSSVSSINSRLESLTEKQINDYDNIMVLCQTNTKEIKDFVNSGLSDAQAKLDQTNTNLNILNNDIKTTMSKKMSDMETNTSNMYSTLTNRISEEASARSQADIESQNSLDQQKKNTSEQYSESEAYSAGSVVMFNNQLYRCLIPVAEGEPFNPMKWSATSVAQVLNDMQGSHNSSNFQINASIATAKNELLEKINANQANIVRNADAYSEIKTYKVGDVVAYNNKLYRCKSVVNTPEAFNVSKWAETTVTELINSLVAKDESILAMIGEYKAEQNAVNTLVSERIDTMVAQQSAALAAAKTELQNDINAKDAAQTSNLAAAKSELQNDINTKDAAQTSNLATAKSELQNDINTKDAAQTSNLATAKSELREDINSKNTAQTTNLATAKSDLQSDINSKNTTQTNNLAAAKSELQGNLDSAKSDLQSKIDTINSKNTLQDTNLEVAKGELRNEINSVNTKQSNTGRQVSADSDAYSNSKTYKIGEIAVYNNKLYKCITAVTSPESFDASKWEETSITEVLNERFRPVSKAEYEALKNSGQLNPSTFYFVTE